ncbi:unnamed protein product [Paramecium octaurelia]|uniref:Uncharacterized protein n=1 Tax=Paramecium octaurelia TaxID=43137 RepID=A0A8S1YQK5_PAROT|nr:unnamed protein product [Paramecium octaurelia]
MQIVKSSQHLLQLKKISNKKSVHSVNVTCFATSSEVLVYKNPIHTKIYLQINYFFQDEYIDSNHELAEYYSSIDDCYILFWRLFAVAHLQQLLYCSCLAGLRNRNRKQFTSQILYSVRSIYTTLKQETKSNL